MVPAIAVDAAENRKDAATKIPSTCIISTLSIEYFTMSWCSFLTKVAIVCARRLDLNRRIKQVTEIAAAQYAARPLMGRFSEKGGSCDAEVSVIQPV
jgi:hypothetical protein